MDERKLYFELGLLTKNKDQWGEKINYVGSLLADSSPKITAKALWMLGEMGLQYPEKIEPYVDKIASFLESEDDLLRERSVNALGRIGRANFEFIAPYFDFLFKLATDNCSNVRLNFIWASENIATNTPEAYKERISVFAMLLDDENDRVRIEAPEMFRVIGKRRPEYVEQYIEKLRCLTEHDKEKVVRIHAKGAIKAIEASQQQHQMERGGQNAFKVCRNNFGHCSRESTKCL